MNLAHLERELARAGWKDLQAGEHMGVSFDLVGERAFFVTKWNVLIKKVAVLDQSALDAWRATYRELIEASKSYLVGRAFFLCLIVQEISIDAIQFLYEDKFPWLRVKGGGGRFLVVSETSRQVYGEVPSLPLDLRKYTKQLIELLKKVLAESQPPGNFARMKSAAEAPHGETLESPGSHSVFLSYSHKDEREKDHVARHLQVLERVGLIELWSDDLITGGEDSRDEIERAISKASVAVLIITVNSLTSDSILEHEIPAILERREKGTLAVVPILAKACAWKRVPWLKSQGVLPRDLKPVWGHTKRPPDTTLSLIAEEIAALLS